MPSATPTVAESSYLDPQLEITLTFPVDMDETVEPLPAQFVIDVDAVPKTPDSLSWGDATHLLLIYSEALLAPSVIRTQYPQMFDNFVSLVGQPVFPFDLLTTPI